MASEAGAERPEPDEVSLAGLQRRTGLTRSKARTLQARGLRVTPHGRTGQGAEGTVMHGRGEVADDLLRRGVTSSSAVFDRLRDDGCEGGLATVKMYVRAHMGLVPPRRRPAAPKGSRGRRCGTGPGEAHQMDRGLVKARDRDGAEYRAACLAVVRHRCGACRVEFFPNARRERLFIGTAHAFMAPGVPETALTDNVRSAVAGRGPDGRPVWQRDHAAFMSAVGFETRLCKARHPWTRGKAERLARFVRDDLPAGRGFRDVSELNREALARCADQGSRYGRALGLVPAEEHAAARPPNTRELAVGDEVSMCLCPRRRIGFDGFVSHEGRRLGVPHRYGRPECRVGREGEALRIYGDDLTQGPACHPVTWGRRDGLCEGRFADAPAPEELPTAPVTVAVKRLGAPGAGDPFAKFDFAGRLWCAPSTRTSARPRPSSG